MVRVRVTTRARRDMVAGLYRAADGTNALAVRVTAAPEDGAANAAVLRCIAKAVGRPASAVTLRAGATARVKTIAIRGDVGMIEAALETAVRPIA